MNAFNAPTPTVQMRSYSLPFDMAEMVPGDVLTVETRSSTWHFTRVSSSYFSEEYLHGVAIQKSRGQRVTIWGHPTDGYASRLVRFDTIIEINQGYTGKACNILLNGQSVWT